MKTCWYSLFLAFLCAIAIVVIGSLGYEGGISKKKLIQIRHKNEELHFLLEEERDKVKDLEEKISRTFTLSIEIR